MPRAGGIAAVAWSPIQRHVTDYAARLNANLYNIHYLGFQRPWLAPLKYIPQCLKTWRVLAAQRPSAVYVFISPVFAALSVYLYCLFARIPFIMDIGGQAFISRKWAWSIPLVRFLARRAAVNIIDQDIFKALLDSWSVNSVMLERPPYARSINAVAPPLQAESFTLTFISTFAPDEPIEAVLGAAQKIPDARFFVLGDTGLAKKKWLTTAPANVTFTGYLRGDDYWKVLHSSQALLALTTDANSLLSAAVEGMAMGKPLILSRQPALTNYFHKGAVFVDNSVQNMTQAILDVRQNQEKYTCQIQELALEKRARWETEFNKIWGLIGIQPSSVESPVS